MLYAFIAGLMAASAVYGTQPQLITGSPRNLLQVRTPEPKPPFRFVREESEGRSPKVLVRDARAALWQVKFGDEVKAEVFATRLVWALGYHSDVTHYVAAGRISGARGLKRAASHIDARGRFRGARFEYRDSSLRFLKDTSWKWKKNPFTGSREFDGLKLLVMLLSNWDNKDAGDPTSNTGILERRGSGGQRIYYVTDWGGSMGKWGRTFFHSKWDCAGFADQSGDFVEKVDDDGEVEFGFSTGNHGGDFKEGITAADVRWIVQRLDRINDSQLRTALRQSGATAHETRHFAGALRRRIRQLERVAGREGGMQIAARRR